LFRRGLCHRCQQHLAPFDLTRSFRVISWLWLCPALPCYVAQFCYGTGTCLVILPRRICVHSKTNKCGRIRNHRWQRVKTKINIKYLILEALYASIGPALRISWPNIVQNKMTQHQTRRTVYASPALPVHASVHNGLPLAVFTSSRGAHERRNCTPK
jgi:hypothetical protein